MTAEHPARTFFVTGATGFIGSHLIEALVAVHGAGAVTALVPPTRALREGPGFHRLNQLGVPLIIGDLLAFKNRPAPAFRRGPSPRRLRRTGKSAGRFLRQRRRDASPARLAGAGLARQTIRFTSTLACVDRNRPRGRFSESTPNTRTLYGRTKLRAEIRAGEPFRLGRHDPAPVHDHRARRAPTGMFGLCSAMLARGARCA
jgi:hypothetical protein